MTSLTSICSFKEGHDRRGDASQLSFQLLQLFLFCSPMICALFEFFRSLPLMKSRSRGFLLISKKASLFALEQALR